MARFDDMMPPEMQQRWLRDINWDDLDGPRPHAPADPTQHERLSDFLRWPYAGETEAFLDEYLRMTVPALLRAEGLYWSLSCLAVPNVYARLVAGGQVTMQVTYDEMEGAPLYDVFLPRALAAAAIGVPVSREGELIDIALDDEDEPFELLIGPATQANAGRDTAVLTVSYAQDALALTELALEQIRAHHLQLMRAHTPPAAGPHCWPLVDHVLGLPR
jgi:hypothetical protein